MKRKKPLKSVGCCILTLLLVFATFQASMAQDARIGTLDELRAARGRLAAKQRRLIANDDGCDCLYFPRNVEPTVQNFLNLRTAMLAGSQVGTISYCPISSGFGHFSHDTKVGTVFTRRGLRHPARSTEHHGRSHPAGFGCAQVGDGFRKRPQHGVLLIHADEGHPRCRAHN
jgi:hypothetical protein